MATTLDELVVKLSADVSQLSAGMQEGTKVLSDSTSRMEQAVSGFAENSKTHLFSFSGAAETALGVFEGEALLEGIKKLGELIKEVFTELVIESVDAAQKQEDAIQRLNVALGGAGQYSKEASEGLQEFAHSLQQSTKYSEENVLEAGALIESLGRLDKDGLQEATKAAVNLSAALGIDLNTAASLVGRAAAGHIETFARYGLVIEQGATNAETFANTLKAVGSFGDVAAQQAMTYSGSVAQLSHSWEDAQKELGGAVVQNQAVVDVLKELSKITSEVAEYIKENKQEIKEWVAEGLIVAIEVTNELVVALDAVMRIGTASFELTLVPLKVLIAGIVAAQQALSGNFAQAWESLKTNAVSAITDIGKALSAESGLGQISAVLNRMETAAATGFAAVKAGADSTVEPTNRAINAVKQLTAEEIKLGEEGKKLVDAMNKADPGKNYEKEVQELKAANNQKLISNAQYDAAVKKSQKDYQTALQQERETEIADLTKKNNLLMAATDQNNKAEIDANKQKIAELSAQEDAHSTFMLDMNKKQKDEEKRIEKERLNAGKSALDELAQFQNSKNSEMAAVGKASAIASTMISTYQGAQAAATALAGIPIIGPELAIAAAAAFVAGGLARVATIEGVPLATGIDSVPGIGNEDNFPAVLKPGERVVPTETNQDLKKFISGNSPMVALLRSIDSKISQVASGGSQPIMVQVDGKTLVTAMRDQIRMGRTVFS
jgi:hypothetical protein